MPVALLHLHLHIPACTSLKQKRGRIKPLLTRLHRQFNISAAEVDRLDSWHEAVIACAVVSNDAVFNQRLLAKVTSFIQGAFPDLDILDNSIENL